MKDNIVKDKSYKFSVDIVSLVRKFPKTTDAYIISKQLLRCGTSVGANVEEAVGGFSRSDFIYKMNLALKECRESHYWIRLIRDTSILSAKDTEEILNLCDELRKILTSIVKTLQENKIQNS